LYGAKKNGKKKSDLPALSRNQLLLNTGLDKFCLTQVDESVKSASLAFKKLQSNGELRSIKSIETEITPKKLY